MFVNVPAIPVGHPSRVNLEVAMRNLPVLMPPMKLERRGSARLEIFYFLTAFAAMFGAALLGLNVFG
jgi:hypothetical protein